LGFLDMNHDGFRFSSAKRGDHDEIDDFVQGKGQYTSQVVVPPSHFTSIASLN